MATASTGGGGIRIWLEPGFDYDRTVAWLADWPGAVAVGPDRAGALDRVASAAHRHVEWLTEHGEAAEPPPLAESEVVEEVDARRLDDGYEVNAFFAAEERAVTVGELEDVVGRLGYARSDLLALVDRVKAFEATEGPLPVEDRSDRSAAVAEGAAPPGRETDEVLRHLAGAEAWFASRLDTTARYAGPARDGDVKPYLEATRAFLVDALTEQVRRDPAATRTDGKGERWSLAKVFRRTLYHSLDHVEELDRRLAVAERRLDRLEWRRFDGAEAARVLDADVLRALFASGGLNRRARNGRELTERMLRGSTEIVAALDGEQLVAFGRIISDEATNAYVSTVVVAPRWQERGVGRRVMEWLMDGRDGLKMTLDARDGAARFYERLGFQRSTNVMVRRPAGRESRRGPS